MSYKLNKLENKNIYQKGDIVFLYKSGIGIIAYGYASGILNKKACDGYPEYEYSMSLDNFVKLKEPIQLLE